jgi:hypothetical protein
MKPLVPMVQRRRRGYGGLKRRLFCLVNIFSFAVVVHSPFARVADDLVRCKSHLRASRLMCVGPVPLLKVEIGVTISLLLLRIAFPGLFRLLVRALI